MSGQIFRIDTSSSRERTTVVVTICARITRARRDWINEQLPEGVALVHAGFGRHELVAGDQRRPIGLGNSPVSVSILTSKN